ncbi:MAG TPA: DNA polymerase III subunit delta' C-terminal domain-containing protein [bacterium]|nr:DNA polymerase III subunit delta' C-terminal domain-containing protein [bacterium]
MPWEQVECHSSVRETVVRAIAKGLMGHTVLIHGEAGAGQVAVARAIAQTYNCKELEHDFCGACRPCRLIVEKSFSDVLELFPWEDWAKPERKGREYSVDHMREMQQFAMALPMESEYKIFLIHHADRANLNAANSLLKILEEPHSHTIFILITENVGGILTTIRSRCWLVRLPPLDTAELVRRLQATLPGEAAWTIARAAGGLPELARQLIADDYLERRDRCLQTLERLRDQEAAVLEEAERMVKAKDDLRDNLTILLRLVRDGVLAANQAGETLFFNPDRNEAIRRLWRNADSPALVQGGEAVLKTLDDLDRYVNPSVLIADLMLALRRTFPG